MKKHFFKYLPVAILGYVIVVVLRIQRGQANRIHMVFKALCDGLVGRMGKPESMDR